jgi:hypothetical protein
MDEMNEFEDKLRQAFLRRPAPPGLKQRILQQRNHRRAEQLRTRTVLWQRLAACFVLAAVIGGGLTWRHIDQQHKGEVARDQVLTALRITNRALSHIQTRLAAHDHDDHE